MICHMNFRNSTFLFLLISFQCFAQKEANIWYFGAQAGVDFNSGSPVSLTNCSFSFTPFEGVGTVCDSTGNLLFYNDGNHVINANHVMMPNGDGLLSNISSTQTGLTVKQPGNDSLWYIFHIDLQSQIKLLYSIVDMSLNGGLGDVIEKNEPLKKKTTEKAAAVAHANGVDVWIITHILGTDEFKAFLLSSTGIDTVGVSSFTGNAYSDAIGYLKPSPQGDKLASADFGMATYSIYDFDDASGIVSNPSVSPANYMYAYGCEWSPDGTKLYGGQENSNDLWQFDVSAGANVWNTATLIYQTTSQEYEALQLGPDGKIYCSRYQTAWLGVINDPDSLGAACNFVDNGVDLQGRVCYLGLPNYNASLFKSPQLVSPGFSASDTTLCEKFCVNYLDLTQNAVGWEWTFEGGDPASSTDQNPTNICYDNPGVYDVTLITTSYGGGKDTVTLADYITVYTNPFAPVITQNGNTLTSSPADSYQWQLNTVDIPGATNQSYEITQSGLYTVIVFDENGCSAQSDIKATLIVGLGEILFGEINIYPNPSPGIVMIEFPQLLLSYEIAVSVYNALGQEIFSLHETISGSQKKEIDLSEEADGVYFIEIKSGENLFRKKIVIF